MKLAFQVKVKNAAIVEAAEKMGGLGKLAEHLGVGYGTLIAWGNLKQYPAYANPKSKRDWKDIEKKLLVLTGLLLEDIFPPSIATPEFLAIPKKHQLVREVDTLALAEARHLALPAAQEDQFYAGELSEKIDESLSTLTPREEKIIKQRFGIGDDEHTLEELAQLHHVSRERLRQIEAKALRKLRHPARSRRLKEWATGMTPRQQAEHREWLRKRKAEQTAKEIAEKEQRHDQGEHVWLLWTTHPSFNLYKK